MSVQDNPRKSGDNKLSEGYSQAIELIGRCNSEHGFLASPMELANYRRVWGRDGAIIGLAALASGEKKLIEGCRCTLETLAKYQGPHGEIPSNVSPDTGRISYGGTAGRVDSGLWFVICCGRYWSLTGDEDFLQRMLEPLEKVRYLLGAWEFNCRGFLYVPLTGDWADEYIQSGYVLYDQLLYLQAQRELASIHHFLDKTPDHDFEKRISQLRHLIRANYWFSVDEALPEDVYHEVLFQKGKEAVPRLHGDYWMPFFTPLGYGYRFDGLANSLVSLFGISNEVQNQAVEDHIAENFEDDSVMLLPAFHPVITPHDRKWEELQMTFSYSFKNEPYEYHNGGLWPLVTGFYAASLARRGKRELARRYTDGIHQANQSKMNGQPWSFPEYLHGKTHEPKGTSFMGWSAAAAILAETYLQGTDLFEIETNQLGPQEAASTGSKRG